MSIKKPLIGFSAFAAVALLLMYLIGNTLAHVVPGSTNTYTASFGDAMGLKPGADVRMAGVRVGRVDAVELDTDDNALVTFVVQDDQPIYSNTKAAVKYQNVIGQRFLGLLPGEGSGEQLKDGGHLPMYVAGTRERQTIDSYDISALTGGIEPLLGSLSPDDINKLTNTLVMALQGDKISLAGFIAEASALSNTFAERDAILGNLLSSLSSVLKGVAGKNAELETLIAQSRSLVSGLYDQGESLKASTTQIATASNSLVGLVTQLRPQLTAAQNSTTEAMNVIRASGPAFDQGAVDGPYMLRDLASIVDSGNYISAYVCGLDISLWNILLPRGLVPMIGGNGHTEVCR